MHDKERIRKSPEAFAAALQRRQLMVDVAALLALDAQDRGGKTEIQNLQAKANGIAKQIPVYKKEGKDIAPLLAEGKALKEQIAGLEKGEGGAFDKALMSLPNLLADEVPEGADESANVEVRAVGQKPAIAAPKDHVALGEALGLMDFEAAAKISGARFVVLRGALARLERALAAFMLDIHTGEFGRDNGIGIPADKLDRIFDRFYQVEHFMSRQYEGLGLGFALAKELLTLHNGRIWVESVEGRGSKFDFALPLNMNEVN